MKLGENDGLRRARHILLSARASILTGDSDTDCSRMKGDDLMGICRSVEGARLPRLVSGGEHQTVGGKGDVIDG